MISYNIGESGQILILEDAVLTHFDRYRQRTSRDREAGGQLFARLEGNTIRVERATGPRRSDRRGLINFIPDRLAEVNETPAISLTSSQIGWLSVVRYGDYFD